MPREEIINEGGIIGSQDGTIDTSSEEFKMLKKIILEESRKQTPQQKQENEFLRIKFQLEDYLETSNPQFKITSGELLKKLMKLYKIRNKSLAGYIGLSESNLSAIIAGRRNINNDLALKLGNIFKIRPEHWINLQNKNDLLALRKESAKEYKKYKLKDLINQV